MNLFKAPRTLNHFKAAYAFSQRKGLTLALVLSLALLLGSNASAELKIWERDDEVRDRFGPIHTSMTKMTNRDAPIGGFQVSAFNRDISVTTVFRGACHPLITVEVMASDARKLDLDRFLQTRSGNDLPVRDLLEITQQIISNECDDQVEVIRFGFKVMHQTEEDYRYEGTLVKSNGWRIQDGRVATDYDRFHTFDIAYRDMFSVAGMRYQGSCDSRPILMLEPQFANNQERALAKPVKMHNWGSVARDVAKLYVKECPDTERIRFILNPMPQDYTCKEQGQDCFLIARKKDDWKIDASQFELKEYYSPISDFEDFVEVLAAGRFDILENYRNFFGFFLESALGAYSDYCQFSIKNPVERRIFTIEREFDDSGFLIRETVDGPPRVIQVEAKYVDTYDRYFNTWKPWATMRMMNSMLNSHHRETNPFLATSLAMGFFTSNINQLKGLLQSSCKDERILTAYENMYNFANNKPPITGKFTTTKKPPVKDLKNGTSAPEATRIIQAERQKKINEQNERARAEAQKRMDDFRARKARGIAVHSGSKGAQQQAAPTTYRQRNQSTAQANKSTGYGNTDQAELIRKHQENQQKIQQLGIDHQKQMMEATQKFSQDMQNATTTEERGRIQKEYQQEQQRRLRELQETVMQLRGVGN